MQTGRGRSPERLASSKEAWPPNSNSKSATTMWRNGSDSSTSGDTAQPFNHRVIEAIDKAVAECDAEQFLERQVRPCWVLDCYGVGNAAISS